MALIVSIDGSPLNNGLLVSTSIDSSRDSIVSNVSTVSIVITVSVFFSVSTALLYVR